MCASVIEGDQEVIIIKALSVKKKLNVDQSNRKPPALQELGVLRVSFHLKGLTLL
jgi:hypothetical protein